jgi:hypothetical protein
VSIHRGLTETLCLDKSGRMKDGPEGRARPTEGTLMTGSPTDQPPSGTAPGPPRWVKVSGVVALAVVVLFLVLHLIGSGMGPGMHGGH